MVIGRYYYRLSQNVIMRCIISRLGILDIHTQLRTKPLVQYISRNPDTFRNKQVVEVGCGSGNNCFETYFCGNPNKTKGFDLDENVIDKARKLSLELGISDKVQFFCKDATEYDFENEEKVDILLLIDFLEHIHDPGLFLKKIEKILNRNAIIIISVPTYNYKTIFGKRFHRKVGHIKDGFNIREIVVMFESIGYTIKHYSYNTGVFGALGCFFHYRLLLKNHYLNLAKSLLLYPCICFDFINNERLSSSLFVVLQRNKQS